MSKVICNYIVLSDYIFDGGVEKFSQKVKKYIDAGWQPIGSAIPLPYDGKSMIFQTMVKDEFPEMTIFHRITSSPEVLAPYLVFFSARDNGWCSMLTAGSSYDTYKEAIAATVAKLKEVCDE